MKKYVIALVVLLCGYGAADSSIINKTHISYTVGSEVVGMTINPTDSIRYFFCAGNDINQNGKFDEGEEKASIWSYDPNGAMIEAGREVEFDRFFAEPFKLTTDLTKGYSTIVLNFAAVTQNFKVVENGYFQGFKMEDGFAEFKTEVEGGQPIIYKQFEKYTVKVINSETNQGSVVVTNGATTNEISSDLNTFAYDAVFVDLEQDGTEELAVITTDGVINFYRIVGDAEAKLIWNYNANEEPEYDGSFGQLHSGFGYVYTTFNESNVLIKLTTNYAGNGESSIIRSGLFDETEVFYPITEEYDLAITEGFDLTLFGNLDFPEKHRTELEMSMAYSNDGVLYLGGGNTVNIYSIENELNLDERYVAKATTPYQPLDIMGYENRYYVPTLGVDFDFDGTADLDSGEQYSSIYSFLPEGSEPFDYGNSGTEIELPFYLNFPVNTNVSSDGVLVLPSGNKVYMYDVAEGEITDSLDAGMYVSTAFSVLDYLVLGQRDYAEGKSYARIINDVVGIDVSEEVGNNIVDLGVYQNSAGFGVVSLSEGTFGEEDAKVNILKLGFTGFTENISIDVGATGSGIAMNVGQTKAAIVMNGSHEVHIIDLLTAEKEFTFSTGTSGFAGPRNAAFVGNNLYVTTYAGKVLIFNPETGDKLSEIIVDGLAEGIAASDNHIYVANNGFSNYSPNNRILAFNKTITNVEQSSVASAPIRIYPHPVANDFHLVSDELVGELSIAIIDGQGKIVATQSAVADGEVAMSADELGLRAGNYTAVINGTKAVRFIVIK